MANRLIEESSPYLLQHAHNPVDWYPWGQEALQKAKDENKMILVSIGYAACHWCHVMEHESFEDQEVAKIMNEHFVCIKVDREERPDVDKIYMDAVMLITQRGGWPLNAFALPDGTPVYGGTYFPKENWINLLNQLGQLWKDQPEWAQNNAKQIFDAMQRMNDMVQPGTGGAFKQEDLSPLLHNWVQQLDYKYGGRKVNANKFPLPMNNLALLRMSYFLRHIDSELAGTAREGVDITLTKMAFGGIYDQIGGGFARYSVDPYWKVPHFEKMLYDNGQLVSLYAEAWQAEDRKGIEDLYQQVVYQTLEFVQRELSSPEGGFYSSLDADSEGEEGKYYVWTYEEVDKILGEDTKLFADYYNIHPYGNWEGNNILFVLETEVEFARRWNLDAEEFKGKMAAGRKKLFEARASRIRPGLDDKVLCSWNALMMKGFVDAYRVFGESWFLDRAIKNAEFISHNMATEEGQLYRNYKNGKRSINAFLDDYAYLIEAYLALYQVTFDEKWLQKAKLHVNYVMQHFHDAETSMFFYTSDQDEVLVKRKMEVQDDVTPSSNAVLAQSLFSLHLLTHETRFKELADKMLSNMRASALESPGWHSLWLQLAMRNVFTHYEVAITGAEAQDYRLELEEQYYPNRIFAGAKSESELPILKDRFSDLTTIYVCEGNTCQLPVNTVEEAMEQMH